MCGPVCSSQLTTHRHALCAYKQASFHGFLNTLCHYSLNRLFATLRKPFHSTSSFACCTHFPFKIWLKLYFFSANPFLNFLLIQEQLATHLLIIPQHFLYTSEVSFFIVIAHLLVCFPYKMEDFCLDSHCTAR